MGWAFALISLIALSSLAIQDEGLITEWSIKRAVGYALMMLEFAIIVAAIVACLSEARTPGVFKVAFLSTFVWSCCVFFFIWSALQALG